MSHSPVLSIFLASIALLGCGGSSNNSGSSASTPPQLGSNPPGTSSGTSGGGNAGSGSGSNSGSGTYVYAGNNNAIAGFVVAQDGTATPIAGSPFPLAGASLVADSRGAHLFGESSDTMNSGSANAYYSYVVRTDGSLAQAATAAPMPDPSMTSSTVAPNYLGWLAIDRTGSTLYGYELREAGNDWIAAYNVSGDGSLTGTQANVGIGQSPLSFTPDNHYGYVTRRDHLDGTIWLYMHNADGTLTINPQSQHGLIWAPPAGSKANVPEVLQVSPTGNYMAVVLTDVSSASGQTGVAVYPINNDGTLGASTPLLTFAPAEGYGPVLTWDSTGTYLFVSYFGGIAEYHYYPAANTLVPVESEIGSTTPPTSMAFLDGHLYVVNYGYPYLSIYNFADGSLRAAPMPPFGYSLGFNPTSIAALRH